MLQLKFLFKLAILSLILFLPRFSVAAVPNAFSTGDPIVASEMNDNFNDLDGRATSNATGVSTNATGIGDNFSLITGTRSDITTLQTGVRPAARSFIDVDCNANPDAFKQSPLVDNFHPYTTFNITGNCNGPIYITSDGVRLVGVLPNRGSSIVLPAGIPNPEDAAVFADGAHDLHIQNLTIDATAWGSFAIAQGTDAAGVYARNAFVRLIDSDIIGGLWGINPFRNAIVRMQGTVNITEFVNAGVTVGDQSLVGTRGQVNISTTRTDGTGYIIGVETYRNGIADFRAGLNITMPAEDPGNGVFPDAITSGRQSLVQVRNSGTIAIVGNISLFRLGSVTIDGGTITGNIDASFNAVAEIRNTTITGNIDAYAGANISVFSSSHSGGLVNSSQSSLVRFQGASSVDATGFGIGAQFGGGLDFRDNTTVAATSGAIGLSTNATLNLSDFVDLGNVGINCQVQPSQVAIGISVTQVGSICP